LGEKGQPIERAMEELKRILTNRIVISLAMILALAAAFEFYFRPFGGSFYQLGLKAYKSGEYARSTQMFREAREYEPNNPAILTMLGWSLLKDGKPALAEKRFRAARRLTPHDPRLQLGLVYTEMRLNHLRRAGAMLSAIGKERPGWIQIQIARGFIFRREGLPRLAAAEFRRALVRDPEDATARENLREISAGNAAVRLTTAALPIQLNGPPPMAVPPPAATSSASSDVLLSLASSLESRADFPAAVAEYRAYLDSHQDSVRALYELGQLLLRTDQPHQAVPVFRRILSIDSQNTGGTLGLAEALAAAHQFREALPRFRKVLKASPGNYEARQGMADVLLWTRQYAAAKTLFEALASDNPEDPVNQRALQIIAHASELEHWSSLRPPPGSPPGVVIQYDTAYLANHSGDHATLVELGANQSELDDLPAAISTYRRIVKLYPSDEDSALRLAQELKWTKRYPEAIGIYEHLLQSAPGDPSLLRKLVQADLQAGRLPAALEVDQRLLDKQRSDIALMLRVAALEMQLKDYPEARQTMATVATLEPGNRTAELGLARLDEQSHDWKSARREIQKILARQPDDIEARYEDARLAYFLGDATDALHEADKVIAEQPRDADALLLAARVENAKRNRRQAGALVARAGRIAPQDAEVGEMQQTLSQESAVTVHTSSTYGREVGPLISYYGARNVFLGSFPSEDLNEYSNSITIGFASFPRSQSYFSIASMPSNSPFLPFPPPKNNSSFSPTPSDGFVQGNHGAVAPSEFQYRQTTTVTSFLTLRGGIGVERFGPGSDVAIPGSPLSQPRGVLVPVRGFAVVGYGGFTVRPTPQFSVDFAISRDGVPYTPLSVRFGVMQVRKLIGARYKPDRRDRFNLTYYRDSFTSSLFDRVSAVAPSLVELAPNGVDKATGGTLDYDRTLIQTERFALGAGYSGEMFGYTGPNRGVYMGFFNPTFYQRHFAVARSNGHIWGPLSYAITGDYGVQQLGHSQPFISAYQFNPSLNVRMSPRFSVSVGYLHYNFSQAFGHLTGNAVELSTDSKLW
jgi:tetratricopeptide (TPR) repeat protein